MQVALVRCEAGRVHVTTLQKFRLNIEQIQNKMYPPISRKCLRMRTYILSVLFTQTLKNALVGWGNCSPAKRWLQNQLPSCGGTYEAKCIQVWLHGFAAIDNFILSTEGDIKKMETLQYIIKHNQTSLHIDDDLRYFFNNMGISLLSFVIWI